MRYLIMLGLFCSQLATAEIYKCVDPRSGAMSFTDKACEQKTSGEPVQVDPTNFNSGPKKQSGNRSWVSQDPNRNAQGSGSGGSSSTGHKRNVEKARGAEQAAASNAD